MGTTGQDLVSLHSWHTCDRRCCIVDLLFLRSCILDITAISCIFTRQSIIMGLPGTTEHSYMFFAHNWKWHCRFRPYA